MLNSFCLNHLTGKKLKKFRTFTLVMTFIVYLAGGSIAQDNALVTPIESAHQAFGNPSTHHQAGNQVSEAARNPVYHNAAQDSLYTPISQAPELVRPARQSNNKKQAKASSPESGSKESEPKLFGYDMFNGSSIALGRGSISENYYVDHGDVFQVTIWGSENSSFTVEITSTGEILLPGFGSAHVSGLSFADMKMAIHDMVGSRLSGYEISVVPIKARKNTIFVVGEVSNPGAYEIDGAATALSALFVSGGPTRQGSMRKIEVRRGKKIVGSFDLYDFLTRGDRSGDVLLEQGDTVFVPLSGPRVFVSGAVRRPAIYELNPKEMNVGEVLTLAGGITQTADLKTIQIRRLNAHSGQIVFSREISRTDGRFDGNSTPVQDLDTIMVLSISPRNLEMVSLEGHVFEPGVRPWRTGLMLSEILKNPEMLKREPALEYGEILREGGAGGDYQVVSFNPGKILAREPASDVELHPRDRIVIFPARLMRDQAKVSINGHVINPGSVGFTAGMRVKDLIYRSGGLKQGASLVAAELSRRTIVNGSLLLDRIEIDLGKAMKDDPLQNITLQPFDSIMIRSVPNWQIDSYINLAGEFKYPGRYSFQPGERLSAVIKRAGGYDDKAYLKAAIFTRLAVKKAQAEARGRKLEQIRHEQQMNANNSQYMTRSYPSEKTARAVAQDQYRELVEILEKSQPKGRVVLRLDDLKTFAGSKFDVVLEPGDELYIPQRPTSVMVEGAVYNSMGVLWEANRSIRHYINMAGGVAKHGDQSNIYLIRADGSVISRATSGSSFLDSTKAEPGDIVLVPTKVRIPVDHWQRNLDIIKVLSNLAVTAYTIDRWRR